MGNYSLNSLTQTVLSTYCTVLSDSYSRIQRLSVNGCQSVVDRIAGVVAAERLGWVPDKVKREI